MEPDPAKELEAEIELLKRIGQGDRRSFEELYDRFAGVLFSTAYRMLKNQQAAEDVLQDVFIQIWKKAPLYSPDRGRPMTWAVTLTRNKAIDLLRATRRRGCLQDNVQQELETFEQFDDRSSFKRSHIGRDEQARARCDAKALEGPAPGNRTRVLFFDDADGNRRTSQRAARHNQSAHPSRDDDATGYD